MMELFGLSRTSLEREMVKRGLPAFRGRQIFRWMYARGSASFEAMTDLPRKLRDQLARDYVIRPPDIQSRRASVDGTIKYQLSLQDGRKVETVYIPDGKRHTFCLSTQVGCPLKCSFCFTGTIGLERNLTVGEILGQYRLALGDREIAPARRNIVFMGMGEPLLNQEAVIEALRILTDEDGYGVSPRRITVSTAGLPAELENFAKNAPAVGLAISLHATTDYSRDRIMPINRAHPLRDLLAVARNLPLPRRRRITFEYVLLEGENDTAADASRLAGLLEGIRAKVNLITYNPWPGSPHGRSTDEKTDRFVNLLAASGLTVSLRRSRGDDVLAACGQLANQ